MPERIRLHIRQSHAVSNAAVGALVQIGDVSVVPCDIRDWGKDGEEVDMPRLSKLLSVSFRKAPVLEKVQTPDGEKDVGGRIPVVRFPKWMYCRRCRRMYHCDTVEHTELEAPLVCPEAACRREKGTILAPMPWVVICANGHMDDVPWRSLTHRDAVGQRQKTCGTSGKLYFVSEKGSGGRLRVECRSCGGAFETTGLRAKDLFVRDRCKGKQPWLHVEEKCDEQMQVVRLGDNYVHYPALVSALDIPPESRLDPRDNVSKRIRDHRDWRRLQELFIRHGKENPLVQQKAQTIAAEQGCQPSVLWNLLSPMATLQETPPSTTRPVPETHLLRNEEYRALLDRITDYREYERFITLSRTEAWHAWLKRKDVPPKVTSLGRYVAELVGVTRLREVRALKGFTRVSLQESDAARLVPSDLEGRSSWLPVAEFYGEGVFFTLARPKLSEWNALRAVQSRTRVAQQGFDSSLWSKRVGVKSSSLPAFIALHTLSHLLIRQMAFECGYPAASLRERLYYSDGELAMAGVLIYLAAGEPGGSLGGIARMAEPERFASLLSRCVETAAWCALDPVCSEHEGRGEARLNRAACHACCLLAETSCEVGNLMLDRRLVVSPPGEDKTGLFDLD